MTRRSAEMNLTNLGNLWMPEIQSEGYWNLLRFWRRGAPNWDLGRNRKHPFDPLEVAGTVPDWSFYQSMDTSGYCKGPTFFIHTLCSPHEPWEVEKVLQNHENSWFGQNLQLGGPVALWWVVWQKKLVWDLRGPWWYSTSVNFLGSYWKLLGGLQASQVAVFRDF